MRILHLHIFLILLFISNANIYAQIDLNKIPKFKGEIIIDSSYTVVKDINNSEIPLCYRLSGSKQGVMMVEVLGEIESNTYRKRRKEIDRYYVENVNGKFYYNDYGVKRSPGYKIYKQVIDSIKEKYKVYPANKLYNYEGGNVSLTFYYDKDLSMDKVKIKSTAPEFEEMNQFLIDTLSKVPMRPFILNNQPMNSYFFEGIHFEINKQVLDTLSDKTYFVPFKLPKWTIEEQQVMSKYGVQYYSTTKNKFDRRFLLNHFLSDKIKSVHGENWQLNFVNEMKAAGINWITFEGKNKKRKIILPKKKTTFNTDINKKENRFMTFHPNGLLKQIKNYYISIPGTDGYQINKKDVEYNSFGKLKIDRTEEVPKSVF